MVLSHPGPCATTPGLRQLCTDFLSTLGCPQEYWRTNNARSFPATRRRTRGGPADCMSDGRCLAWSATRGGGSTRVVFRRGVARTVARRRRTERSGRPARPGGGRVGEAVSYTHLTLPTN